MSGRTKAKQPGRPRAPPTTPTTPTGRRRVLDEQRWYHGVLSRGLTSQMLREHGDWLVRATLQARGRVDVVISLKWADRFHHYLLEYKNRRVRVRGGGGPSFVGAADLVDHYQKHALNSAGVKLLHAVPRPNWMIASADVVRGERIGEGAFGYVYVGRLRHVGREVSVAVKSCKDEPEDADKDELVREARLMACYHHRHVVRFLGVAADTPPLMIVLELCPGGSLLRHLQVNAQHITDEERLLFCLEAARGLEYLSVEKHCIHRDVAARNCLIGESGEVKISDFGLSHCGAHVVAPEHQCMPVRWMAPESITLKPTFTRMTDVWSFGILAWEVFAGGKDPWPQFDTNRQVAQAIRAGRQHEMPARTPPGAIAIMRQCWQVRADARPNFTTIVQEFEKVYRPSATPRSTFLLSGVDATQCQPVPATEAVDEPGNAATTQRRAASAVELRTANDNRRGRSKPSASESDK